MPRIYYENFDRSLVSESGKTILETSLANNIPHAHACGGNAVCSSCRVRVIDGLSKVYQRNKHEKILAERLGFTEDIRLGCQAKLNGDIIVKLPVIDEIDLHIVSSRPKGENISSVGEQRELSFLFADMEGFTRFTESTPPYDVVHVLNRYYYIVGRIVGEHKGFIVDYFGDGFLAVFGVERAGSHALDAVKAGLAISESMKKLNMYVESLLDTKFKLRVGIHSDRVILGSIGLDGMKKLSVIGDGVNFASRLENANKDLGTYFLISEKTYNLTKTDIEVSDVHVIEVKGKEGLHHVYEVSNMGTQERGENESVTVSEIEKHIKDHLHIKYISRFVRLVFHDVSDFNPKTGRGGMNASVLHEENLKKEENQFVTESMIQLVDTLKAKFPSVSKSDILALMGAIGIHKLGGPKISIGLGRIDYNSLHETGDTVTKNDDAHQLKNKFSYLGLNIKELVVLSGAHTLNKGYLHTTNDPFNFSNNYFKTLLNKADPNHSHLLHTDMQLLKDEELMNYVKQYALDEKLFHEDFAKAYQKLTLIGQNKANIKEIDLYRECDTPQ